MAFPSPLRLLAAGAIAIAAAAAGHPAGDSPTRHETLLGTGWRTAFCETGAKPFDGFEQPGFNDAAWRTTDVPHNWDSYEGARQIRHGNLHGTAFYRRTFDVPGGEKGRRVFLFFEGVGSYAAVWVNGRSVGSHAGGLTTFTLDVTDAVRFGAPNVLAVRADHPAGIRDLPWVCGGCERAAGFSEGPQPLGIFRPVHLVTTAPLRIEPFGVHAWNDRPAEGAGAPLAARVATEIRNYGPAARSFVLRSRLVDRDGRLAAEASAGASLQPGATAELSQELQPSAAPHLWSPEDPFLYTVRTSLLDGDRIIDETATPFGFRWIEWPDPAGAAGQPFRVNGRPVFLNGIGEYEHRLGSNHAFSEEEVRARVRQVEAAGFNAFRDAHHPHNLRYQEAWDSDGILWWPQFSAHAWFDSQAFRDNFKKLLRDWVRERRNSPSLVLWGLQNESQLPEAFARECADLIRSLDPTAVSQRRIVTCNGGTGTDWDVPQNWSGTYNNTDPAAYASDLKNARLVGEYGAWRSLGLHSEGGFTQGGALSEDRMCALLEMKIRLAESVRGETCGHFAWILATHANPGRTVAEHGEQLADGFRALDQVSPANNKGLFTAWGESLDAFYLYEANYAPPARRPMVYIVSHTWPDRWTAPGRKSGIAVYSNCEEVELFNDVGDRSLGRRIRGGRGTHFQWDDVPVEFNVLYAEGRVAGKVVATDCIVLHHLPAAPRLAALTAQSPAADPTSPVAGRNYLYRVNCGGPEYADRHGQRWLADRDFRGSDSWGSVSWAAAYPNLPPELDSQRSISDPITGTGDGPLFQSFRYGREKLRYLFAVPDGDYLVELFFIEPWYGTGGGDCAGWRLFDVAVNDRVLIRELDLWKEAGRARAVKKALPVSVRGGRLEISFPRVVAGQAVISAIAISTADPALRPPPEPPGFITGLEVAGKNLAAGFTAKTHLNTGDRPCADAPGAFSSLPPDLFGADWIQTVQSAAAEAGPELLRFTVTADADVYVAFAEQSSPPAWLTSWDQAGKTLETSAGGGRAFALWRRSFDAGSTVILGAAGGAPMYSVIALRRRPPAPAQSIAALAASGVSPQVLGGLRTGDRQYSDDPAVVTKLPLTLFEADWIRTGRRVGNPVGMRFRATDNVEVHVAFDARAEKNPGWASDWIATGLKLETSSRDAGEFRLEKKRFAPGDIVVLGDNARLPDGAPAAMYTVIVRTVRPSHRFPVARIDGATGAAEWTISVGVGDRYGLNFRYKNPGPKTAAEVSILDADGRVIRTNAATLPATSRSGDWEFYRTRTGTSLNAGTYRIRLAPMGGDAKPEFDYLEVE